MDLAAEPRELAAAGLALWLLPLVGVLLAVFTGGRANGQILFVAVPLGSAALAYLLSRLLLVPAGRSLLWGVACLVSCLACNACALLLVAVLGL